MSTPTTPSVRFIPLTYNNGESQTSALRLVLTLFPSWETDAGPVEFTRFTDGITNTLLKIIKRRPGLTDEQIDGEAVLLRAYGQDTDVLIDRDRETASHLLLSERGLAPPLLARFQNGLLYRFIRGRVCASADLAKPAIYLAVARRLGQWHALLPTVSDAETPRLTSTEADDEAGLALGPSAKPAKSAAQLEATQEKIRGIAKGKLTPNLWSVMQKWILALPEATEAERVRRNQLQDELERVVRELGDRPGLGKDGLVFGHCDLLSGNVIIHPPASSSSPPSSNDKSTLPTSPSDPPTETVSFIDYEYATPSPAAFDIANHLAEWGGFECIYAHLPTIPTRHAFLAAYLESYNSHLPLNALSRLSTSPAALFAAVDAFRGIPGLYWGIWALIQAQISHIDFDYAAYAELRLGEYWAWRAEVDGSREREGRERGEREARWASLE
ncbi:MAG: hypothetical protein M1824_002616 [Vezdaea acicularis]|nr:MAG: hypothetical protein M1824_002616 [Vezdaea acicularis]